MTLRLSFVGRSDVGLVRTLNEDSGYADAALALVADGMGGHAAGEVASRIAAETAVDSLAAAADPAAALAAAEAQIGEAIVMDPDLRGMGTTLTLARLVDETLTLAHVGDSRAYLLQHGEFRQVTRDHTFVQQLVDEGSLDPADIPTHPARSVLTQALDGSGRADPDVTEHRVGAGDRLLLCSDGLSGVVGAERLAELVAEADLAQAADLLIAAALAGGAPDNVTAVLAEVVEATSDQQVAVWLGAVAPRSDVPDIPPQLAESATAATEGDDYGDLPAGSHGGVALLGGLLMVVGILGLGLAGAHVWASQQWHVAAVEGRATVIRGLPNPALGLPTGGPVEISEVRPTNLPATERQRLAVGIRADDADEAAEILDRLRVAEASCLAKPTDAAGCPG